jgi:hypothetical protein
VTYVLYALGLASAALGAYILYVALYLVMGKGKK